MTQITPALRTGYSLARCALGIAEPHLRSHVPQLAAKCARIALAMSDLAETAYIGWQVQKELYERDKELMGEDKKPVRLFTDFGVRICLLFGVSALTAIAANRFLAPPPINLADLLQETRAAREVAAGTLTASFTKSLLETCIATLGIANMLLHLSHAYLTSSSRSLVHAVSRAVATGAHLLDRRTLELTHTMSPFTEEWMKRKVEVAFHLNTAGLSKDLLTEKLLSIYDYSLKVFNDLKNCPNYQWKRNSPHTYDTGYYKLVMRWLPRPAPLIHRIRILLKGDTENTTFQVVDLFRVIPRLWVRAREIVHPDSWRRVELVRQQWHEVVSLIWHLL